MLPLCFDYSLKVKQGLQGRQMVLFGVYELSPHALGILFSLPLLCSVVVVYSDKHTHTYTHTHTHTHTHTKMYTQTNTHTRRVGPEEGRDVQSHAATSAAQLDGSLLLPIESARA